MLLDQNYCYKICHPTIVAFDIKQFPQGPVCATFKDDEFVPVSVDYVLDRDGTERCQKAIRKFEHDSGMILHDDDEIEEVVVYVENYDILKAKDVATMVEFHKAHSILKKVERAMDWVSSLKDTSIMIGFDEFSACDKSEHNLAISLVGSTLPAYLPECFTYATNSLSLDLSTPDLHR
ncbi:hypothetical protein PF005_g31340 [Phytophthora fragariae]|uniref:Uncharacterized protein n=1 Tax=Phytophthora fragariae TaxID=53985 RepID=A0A6A3V9E6_9STRA|nr:hypothetical protein PF005_g31340 [Phytophthora fragariae]